MEPKKRKTYRNFTRSEKAIIHAYVELMQSKERGRITVTDIVNKADLNRSTFYAHFKSVEDVPEKIHADIISKLLGSLDNYNFRNSLSNPHLAMRHILTFIKQDEEMYKILLNTDGAPKFLRSLKYITIQQYLSDETILPYIKDRDEFELNLRLFIGGFISIIEDWASGNLSVSLERATEVVGDAIKKYVRTYTN